MSLNSNILQSFDNAKRLRCEVGDEVMNDENISKENLIVRKVTTNCKRDNSLKKVERSAMKEEERKKQ